MCSEDEPKLTIVDPSADDIWAGYDPEKALAGMKVAAGRWQGMDAEAFKEFIYRARKEGSRPPDRPRPFQMKRVNHETEQEG